MPSKRSRSSEPGSMSGRSVSTPSMYDGTVLDRKTRQPLFFECRVCMLGRNKLSKDEVYSENKAEVVMSHLYEKRQSHCILYCLEDCLRFEKSKRLGMKPMRNFVKYSAIKHIFIFHEKPNVFMLCIDSGRSDRRTYEAFKCKLKEDVITICELVFKASKDPEYKLRDLSPIKDYVPCPGITGSLNQFSTNDLSAQSTEVHSTNTVTDVRSTNLGVQNVFEMYQRQAGQNSYLNNDEHVSEIIEQPVSRTLDYEIPQGNAVERMNDETAFVVPSDMDEVLALHEKLTTQNDDEWEVSITYLQWDNIHGARLNDRGPVYMYVARSLRPVNA